ncbi:MAG TPA: GFA family protein [Solirubrobacterales bacterium]|nr:GFA family protein [Solirubrobacterales bacterium]
MPSAEQPLLGSCLCGGVRLQITGPFLRASYCHCHHCQKRTGSAASAQGRVAQEHFELLDGHNLLKYYVISEGTRPKVFCLRCGSSLFSGEPLSDPEVSVRLGLLDGDPGIRPEVRAFTDSAAGWATVPDDLPHIPGPPQ